MSLSFDLDLGWTCPGPHLDKMQNLQEKELDRGSIKSSPRYGLSTPYRLTKGTVLYCHTISLCTWKLGL